MILGYNDSNDDMYSNDVIYYYDHVKYTHGLNKYSY